MLVPSGPPSNPRRRKLLEIFDQLAETEQGQLLAFGEFLAQRQTAPEAAQTGTSAPKPIPRPAEESVVAAIKRLSKTYYMVDTRVLLHEASTLLSAHILQGRPAAEVIDELETLFEERYLAETERLGD